MAICVFFGMFARTALSGDRMGGANLMACFLFLADIEGMRWPIAGGGNAVLRKVHNLLPYGTVIEVVSSDTSPSLDEMAQDTAYTDTLELIGREFEDKNLDRADFVIATTSEPGLNSRISVLCRPKKVSVNMVDAKGGCSFILPSIARDEPVVAGISISGINPAIARYLKARIRSVMSDSLGELTTRLGAYREMIKDLFLDSPRVCSALFYELAEEGLSYNGCLIREQAQIIVNRKLGQEYG